MKKRNLFLIFLFTLIASMMILLLWTASAEKNAHYTPEYEQIDLAPVLQKEEFSDADYAILFRQTGLARTGVDELCDNGGQEDILYLQQRLFAPIEYECRRSVFLCSSERIVEQSIVKNFLPAAQNGDILITFSGHFFGWRSGHAGIVINAEEGQTLEAITIGQNSQICSLNHWSEYPCFALLRLKNTSEEERAEIAAYAAQNLADISYELASFCERNPETEGDIWGLPQKKSESDGHADSPVSGTHCAHLVWLAYRHFGYDLDSDGGYVVTPRDLYESDLLELVQIYGISPE